MFNKIRDNIITMHNATTNQYKYKSNLNKIKRGKNKNKQKRDFYNIFNGVTNHEEMLLKYLIIILKFYLGLLYFFS